MLGFLYQKNISEKNILRLNELETHGGEKLKTLARIVREIALVCPRPKKRWWNLRLKHPELYHQAAEIGLCEDELDDDDGWPYDTWIYPGTDPKKMKMKNTDRHAALVAYLAIHKSK